MERDSRRIIARLRLEGWIENGVTGSHHHMRYIAFIHKDADTCYGVSFPDFPGCISAGDTLDAVMTNASEALGGHVRMMEADGDAVPPPR